MARALTFLSSQLILLPSLAESKGNIFSGWFGDDECTSKFTSSYISTETTLYGGWRCTVTFNENDGTPAMTSKSVVYGQKYGILPNPSRTGYIFLGWFMSKDEGITVTNKTKG